MHVYYTRYTGLAYSSTNLMLFMSSNESGIGGGLYDLATTVFCWKRQRVILITGED